MATHRSGQNNPPTQAEPGDEPISLVGVLEAQNADLRNMLADLVIQTAVLRRQVAIVENTARVLAMVLVPAAVRAAGRTQSRCGRILSPRSGARLRGRGCRHPSAVEGWRYRRPR